MKLEIPLNPYDSCRLLAINLYSYVVNPFTDKAYFDTGKFFKHVIYAQRLMDDLVDLEIEKLDKIIDKIKSDPEPYSVKEVELDLWTNIRDKAIKGRRTGLGITGEGDMLAALGLRYGTTEATKQSESIHKNMAIQSYISSITMAAERGPFTIWDKDKDLESGFISRVIDKLPNTIKNTWVTVGRRNIGNLTIAPTGTVSLMTQTTSGIEPVFLITYKRRRKTDDPTKCVFKDEVGDMWEEYNVFHPKFKVWFDTNKMGQFGIEYKELEELTDSELDEIIKLSPYYKATSADVDHFEKIKMQGAIQKWVDHSISMTTNVPKETTQETVDEIYRLAWESGCKGATIYRDGSRSGVLVSSTSSTESEIVYVDSPKRPKTLEVDIYTKKVLGKEWTVLVGLLKGKPYEVFALPQFEHIEFNKNITKGTLTKEGKQKYKLKGVHSGKEYVIDNIIKYMSPDEQFQTRDFSRSLRHGQHPKHIISDIDKSSYISSFRRVISRVLKNYLSNEDVSDSCPNCKSSLTFESGCKTCKECGWSACG